MVKIAITGVESTGKSTLARDLAKHFKGVYIAEFARSFLNEFKRPYTYDDILTIAKNQDIEIKKAFTTNKNYIFADTELLVTYVWCAYKYEKIHPWIKEQLKKQTFDLYLLPAVDLPWHFDPLRENPLYREKIFKSYQNELERLNFPYVIIKGKGDDRLQNAIREIESRF